MLFIIKKSNAYIVVYHCRINTKTYYISNHITYNIKYNILNGNLIKIDWYFIEKLKYQQMNFTIFENHKYFVNNIFINII